MSFEEKFQLGLAYFYGKGVEQNYEEAVECFREAAVLPSEYKRRAGESGFERFCTESGYEPTTYNKFFKISKTEHNGAKFRLGLAYFDGKGVEQDYEEAVKCFEVVVEENSSAEFGLGLAYFYGKGVEQNNEKAFECFREATRFNVPEVPLYQQNWENAEDYKSFLEFSGFEGNSIGQDYKEAVEWFRRVAGFSAYVEDLRKQAEQGQSLAQYRLGIAYSDSGWLVEQDYKEAVKWFRKASLNRSDARARLGLAYFYGEGVEQSYEEAVNWFKKAIELEEIEGALYVRMIRSCDGEVEDEGSLDRCFKPYDKKVGLESARAYGPLGASDADSAKFFLSICYASGKGVERDCEKAKDLYRELYYGEDSRGYEFDDKYIDRVDDEGKAKWYRKSAESGDPHAQYNLGLVYWNHRPCFGEEDNPNFRREAVKWFRKAAASEKVNNYEFKEAKAKKKAEYHLGLAYLWGEGVEEDSEEGVKWIRKSAESGYPQAQFLLGQIYHEGELVEKNYEEAKKWYEKAAKKTYGEDEKTEILAKGSLEILEKDIELEEKNRKLEEQSQELEDVMAMFAHKFRGPLNSIAYLEKSPRILEDVRVMGGLLDVFSSISIDRDNCLKKLRSDMYGEGTLNGVLKQAIVISVASLLTLSHKGHIGQHLFEHAKRNKLIAPDEQWGVWVSRKSPYRELKERLRCEWQADFMNIVAMADLGEIQEWFKTHFCPIEFEGFDSPVRFERYEITESLLLIIVQEIFLNAVKYYAHGGEKISPVRLSWGKEGKFFVLCCSNPTSKTEFEGGKGSHKGHKFLSLIAQKVGGDFPETNYSELFTVKFLFPADLLIPGQEFDG